MTVKKIISGGQTGADYAGLLAAKFLKLETGGWMPKNFKTEDGDRPELAEFGIKCLETSDYPTRTKKNVDDSDGTVVFRLQSSVGSDNTIGYAQSKIWKAGVIKTMNYNETTHKPVCVINNIADVDVAATQLRNFIVTNNIQILNVAGHRESSAPVDDFSGLVYTVITKALL